MRKIILSIIIVLLYIEVVHAASEEYEKGYQIFLNGKYELALQTWLICARGGDPACQFGAGGMFYNGDGTPQSYEKSMYWFKEAAERGDRDAMYMVSMHYLNGLGSPLKEKDKAKFWLELAAERGHEKSKNLLDKGVFNKK